MRGGVRGGVLLNIVGLVARPTRCRVRPRICLQAAQLLVVAALIGVLLLASALASAPGALVTTWLVPYVLKSSLSLNESLKGHSGSARYSRRR